LIKGTIKSTGRGGFGFIDGEDGKVYFLHASCLLPSSAKFDTLTRGQAVVFEAQEGAKGSRATSVFAETGPVTFAPDDL
jgi:cold shock CspA family protein